MNQHRRWPGSRLGDWPGLSGGLRGRLSGGLGRGFGSAAGVWLLLALLAEVVGRAAGIGALGPGLPVGRGVALTFDDGPSARTPELLAVLAQYGARATFFVTEPACRAFPQYLEAIRAAGHGLEAHGRWHTHALLLAPWQEWRQVAWHPRAHEAGPHLYRPPYGGHGPLTRLLARILGREVALWDTEGRDWTAQDAATLARQTLPRLRPGCVLLLHDGPEVTPELLRQLLSAMQARGLQGVSMAELPPRRIGWHDGLRRVWQSYGA